MTKSTRADRTAATSPPTILLIEDSPTYRELALYLLESLGYVVTYASTAENGLRQARDDPPDLILIDVNLPGMGGVDAIKALRQDARLRAVPAIALTAEPWSEEGEHAATQAGFDLYLSKPIDAKTFEVEIGRLVPGAAPGRKRDAQGKD